MSSSISSAAPLIGAEPSPQELSPFKPTFVPLFVCQLPPTTVETLLYTLFSPFGTVSSIKVIRDKGRSQCKGYGFVNMAHLDEALRAVNTINGFVLDGRKITVAFKHEAQRLEAEMLVNPQAAAAQAAAQRKGAEQQTQAAAAAAAAAAAQAATQAATQSQASTPHMGSSILEAAAAAAQQGPAPMNHAMFANPGLYAAAGALQQQQQQQFLQYSASLAAAGLMNPGTILPASYNMPGLPYATHLPATPFVGGYPVGLDVANLSQMAAGMNYRAAPASFPYMQSAPSVTLSSETPASPQLAAPSGLHTPTTNPEPRE